MDRLGAEVIRTFFQLMATRVDTVILALRKAEKNMDKIQERGLGDWQFMTFRGVEREIALAKVQLRELQNEFRTFPVVCGNQMANL